VAPQPERPVLLLLGGQASRDNAAAALRARGFTVLAAPSPDGRYDVVADARALVEAGRPEQAGRVVAVAAMGDPAGSEALASNLADCLIRRPLVQAEWTEIMARLADGQPFRRDNEAGTGGSEALPDFSGLRVLVADDSALNREVASEALARLGIRPELAEDGRQALEAVRASQFDLIFLDGSMPIMDGYEASRTIRADEAASGQPRLRIVALTAHVVGAAAEAWREAGMDDVLHKPFTIAQLARCIEAHTAGFERSPAAAAPAPVRADEVLDLDTLASLDEMERAGVGGFTARIFGMFRDNAPEALDGLRVAIRSGDPSEAASATHKLRSMSLNIGAAALGRRLAQIEASARETGVIPAEDVVDELGLCLAATLAALDERYGAAPSAAGRQAA
jgi:CheY-like chemotaxis protein